MKILKLIGKIMAVFLSFILTLVFIVLMLFNSFKGMISSKNMTEYVKDANILNMDLSLILNQEENITLSDKIYDLGIEIGIPKEIVLDILKSDEINEVLGEFFNKTIIYIVDGGDKPQISLDTTTKMLEVAKISLADNINIMIDEEELENYIHEYSVKLSNLIPDRTIILNEFPIHSISGVLNFNQLYIYLSICLIALLIMICLLSIRKTIKYISIPMIISGVIFVILGSMSSLIDDILLSQINNMKALISPLITNFSAIIFKNGILFSFTGIFLIILYVVVNRIVINNKKIKQLEETRRINIEDINIK